MRFRVKTIIGAVVALLLIGAAVTGYIACRCDRPGGAVSQSSERPPPGWVAPPKVETPWLPFKKNVASEFTKEFPPGSKVVVVETESGEKVEVGILPGGQIVTKEGVKATIYEKREALIEGQIRPFIGAGGIGPELGVAVAAGIDVVRVWKINVGVGALINNKAVSGAGFAAYPVWRNVDFRVGGGYGTAGGVGFAGVSIGIE